MTIPLAEAVLPLLRTRADLHRYGAANQHGGQMHRAIDILESAVDVDDPAEVYAVTHKALGSATLLIARADDSSGIIGHACRRLLALHPQAAAAAHVSPSRLVDWMMKFQFDGDVDFFELDPVAYAPALGERGLASYRARLDEVAATLSPEPADRLAPDPDRHERWVLEWNAKRLAVLDHDVEAIIRTHARDRSVAFWLHETAKAFEEIGESDLAIDWARQGMDVGPTHQAINSAEYWCSLLGTHRPDEEFDARLAVFRRWPSNSTATQLYRAAGAAWASCSDEVLAALSSHPTEAVLFTLLTLGDVPRAWELAQSLGLQDHHAWAELLKAYEKIDPLATLPNHRRLVERELLTADAHHYRLAARRLAKMRALAEGTPALAEVDDLIAELRETHRRRPRLQQEFDRADLP